MTAPLRQPGLRTLTTGLFLAFAATFAATSAGAASASVLSSNAVVVRPGDSLWALAERHRTTVATLQELNALQGRTTIYAGESLRIAPAARNAVPTATTRSAVRHRAQLADRQVPGPALVKAHIVRTARAHGVDPALVLAVAWQESGFQQGVVSSHDAIGAMQVLPATGRDMDRFVGRHLDLLHARDNVLAGVLLLKSLLQATDSVGLTLAGYYQGLGSVQSQGLLPQTHAYIRNIHALRALFAQP